MCSRNYSSKDWGSDVCSQSRSCWNCKCLPFEFLADLLSSVFLHSISHAMFCIGVGHVWNSANYFYLSQISCLENSAALEMLKKMCDIMIELFYVFIKTKYLTKLRWRIMYSKSLLENKQQGLSVMLNAIYYNAAYQINKLHWHGILIWGFCWFFCTVLVRLVLSFYHNNKEYTAIIFQCYLIYHFKSTITFFYRVVS